MKTYFAKYLPVEGEINIGDKYFTKQGKLHSLGIKPNSEMLNPEESLAKAKLFLCSRDIQIGDKVKLQLIPNKTKWLDGKVIEIPTDTVLIKLKNDFIIITNPDSWCFKVIGEISPEATWVKEGDEFDESVVQIMGENQFGELHDLGLYKKSDNVNIVCLIKGPCGHFH